MSNKRLFTMLMSALLFISVFLVSAMTVEAEDNKYYFDEVVNTGKDNGYTGNSKIDKKDPHWQWKLGVFYVDGYSRVIEEADNPIFLKNQGDNVTLWFRLDQDINCLNGNEKLTIHSDKNGYDEVYDAIEGNLGRGTLIIKYTDYQNETSIIPPYTDYLEGVEVGADTKVELCEEGDYEVSLLYEIKDNGVMFFDSYHDYRVSFKFSVRNGNTMVFPFDIKTKQELTNSSYTENGFYLDLAKSRYLTIDIKKEVLQEGTDGLVEDVRFNKPVADETKFVEEGIYTITVTNKYTNRTTEKKIYVGTNSILKAHVVTGLPIGEIEEQVASGATVAEDGTIVAPSLITSESTYLSDTESIEEMTQTESMEMLDGKNKPANKKDDNMKKVICYFVVGGIILLLVVILIITKLKKRERTRETANKDNKSSKQ